METETRRADHSLEPATLSLEGGIKGFLWFAADYSKYRKIAGLAPFCAARDYCQFHSFYA
jgi:hypothetical protein